MIPLLLALLAASPASVVVSPLQTGELAQQCGGTDADRAGLCAGYVMGAFDTLSLSHQICPSVKRASTGRAVGVVRKYLKAHPDRWDSAPAFLIRAALTAAYPCSRK